MNLGVAGRDTVSTSVCSFSASSDVHALVDCRHFDVCCVYAFSAS